jgi:hypothetical protein
MCRQSVQSLAVIDPITNCRISLTGERIYEYLCGEGDYGLIDHPKWHPDEAEAIQRIIKTERIANSGQYVSDGTYFYLSSKVSVYDWVSDCYIILTKSRAVAFLTVKHQHLEDEDIFRQLQDAEALVLPYCQDKLISYPKRCGKIGVVKMSSFKEISPEYAIWRMRQREQLFDDGVIDRFGNLAISAVL